MATKSDGFAVRIAYGRRDSLKRTAQKAGTLVEVAIVQDHIAQRGGAERVLLSLTRLPLTLTSIRTSVFVPESTYPEFAEVPIKSMWFSRIRTIRRNHRLAFPFMAPGFASIRSDADVTLCCSAGWSHGVRASGEKVVYWFAPARWIHQREQYIGSTGVVARFINLVGPLLDLIDRRAVHTADRHLAVSEDVASRLLEIYGITAEIVHPPVVLVVEPEPFETVDGPIMLVVSRLIGYKNVDVVVDAFSKLPGVTLYVVGDGPQRAELEELAGDNVRFAGSVTDGQLRTLYERCSGVVTAAFEDFGLTPVEAALHGKPTAALRAGGHLETIDEGKTGFFFDELSTEAVCKAVSSLLEHRWDSTFIQNRSERFSEERFLKTIGLVLSGCVDHV